MMVMMATVCQAAEIVYWIQPNGTQRYEVANRADEIVISVPVSRPLAYVWFDVISESTFTDVRLALETGTFPNPKPYFVFWYYTPFPTSWSKPPYWYGDADQIIRGRFSWGLGPGQTSLGLATVQLPRTVGTYQMILRQAEPWDEGTWIKRNGVNVPVTWKTLTIIVRPD